MTGSNRDVSCSWVQEAIDSYIDGDLPSDEEPLFERHVNGCGRCRHELAIAESVVGELRALPSLTCPDHVTDRVLEHTDASRAREQTRSPQGGVAGRWIRRLGAPRPALAGVMVILIVVASVLVGRFNKPGEQISPAQVEEAEAALRWTFAYVNEVSRLSGLAVRDEVFEAGVLQPVQRAVRSALDTEARARQENGGSI
jgi:anti-sigma factor RsiW